MGGLLSCASSSDPYLSPLDYSVTIKPSEDVDSMSLTSLDVYQNRSTTNTSDRDLSIKNMETCNGHAVNCNKEKHLLKLSLSRSFKSGRSEASHSWKFWRRFSTRSRNDSKSCSSSKEGPEIILLERADHSKTLDSSTIPALLSGPLPDVVEKAPRIPPYNGSVVPPPKPPRLFLFRSQSATTEQSTSNDRSSDQVFINRERATELRSSRQNSWNDDSRPGSLSGFSDCIRGVRFLDLSENNNMRETSSSKAEKCDNGIKISSVSCTAPFRQNSNDVLEINSSIKSIPQPSQLSKGSSSSIASKIKSFEPSINRQGKSFRRPSDKGEITRQRHIMNSISELLRQRLDPYPVLEQFKRSGVLEDVDVQTLVSHHDRKSVCESIVGLVGDANPDMMSMFCNMLTFTGDCPEILEILQVMREMDRIVHDVSFNTAAENVVLTDEKNLNYEIGYLAPDYSLKPLIELDRVRMTSDKRLSKTSNRNSDYSILEGGDGDCRRNGDFVLFPGLVMMSICITGHNLSGQRAETLANVIRNHNCISELHMGKTQLCGQDICVLTKALENNRTVHSLDLRLNSIDQTGAVGVAELLQKTKCLQHLNLSSSNMDSTSIKIIMAAASSNRTLSDLDLSFLDIGDECSECLRDMLKVNTSLQKLRLRNNALMWSGCYVLAEGLVRNMGLVVLDLSGNAVGDDGVHALAKFLPESSVTDVCLEKCGITSRGCDAVAEIVTHCKKLKHLDISTNLLLDVGIYKLATALERTSSLENLGLNMCGVTNDGFSKLLDVLEKNTSIVHMKLCYNRLGREHSNPSASSENLRYRLRIVTSSRPKLRILLWGNSFEDS